MRKQILVVEADETMQLYLQEVLRSEYKVVLKKDAREALDWINKHHIPDAVLIATDLTAISGIDLLSMLRLQFDKEDLPVIMITPQLYHKEEEDCFRGGANDYLAKPLDPHYLIELLRQSIIRAPLRKVS